MVYDSMPSRPPFLFTILGVVEGDLGLDYTSHNNLQKHGINHGCML